MKGAYKLILCVAALLPATLRAQVDTARAYVDSLMSNDSLMKDLSAFIDSVQKPHSLLALELGVGNGFFTSKSATAATGYVSKTFLTPTVTYLHKSGLGISASAYATEDLGKVVVYQGAITPSFDLARRNWAGGVSYTRYINKDSVSFGLNPLRNDFYGYFVWKKWWLEPGVAYDMSFDSYESITRKTKIGAGGTTNTVKISDVNVYLMSGLLTLQHDFEWFGVFNPNDHIAFTPTLMTLADKSDYSLSVSKSVKEGVKERADAITVGTPLTPPVPMTSHKTSDKSGPWTIESTGILLDAVYTYKHFLFSPQILTTCFFNPSAGVQPLRISYLANIGLVF